jgi:hypothetical protein
LDKRIEIVCKSYIIFVEFQQNHSVSVILSNQPFIHTYIYLILLFSFSLGIMVWCKHIS